MVMQLRHTDNDQVRTWEFWYDVDLQSPFTETQRVAGAVNRLGLSTRVDIPGGRGMSMAGKAVAVASAERVSLMIAAKVGCYSHRVCHTSWLIPEARMHLARLWVAAVTAAHLPSEREDPYPARLAGTLALLSGGMPFEDALITGVLDTPHLPYR